MKPYELQLGDRFRVAAACNPDELVDTYEVMTIGAKGIVLKGRHHVVTSVTMTVRVNGAAEVVPLQIGPWVEVQKLG